MTLGLFVPRSFVSPDGSCGYIPRRRLYFSMAGSGLSRVHRTAVYGGQPLTVCPGYAFSPASGGGISSRAAPFPKNGKGRGVWVDPLHYRIGGFQDETTPCIYHRRMVRQRPRKHTAGGAVLPHGLLSGLFANLPDAQSAAFPKFRRSRGA